MNKSGTAKILMGATILLIIAFQVYWIKKLYNEEDTNFKKSADVIFRETMYRLQATRFTGDTMEFRGLPDNNTFMTDIISDVQRVMVKEDSPKHRMLITMNTSSSVHLPEELDSVLKTKKDTVIYVNPNPDSKFPAYMQRLLEHNKTLSDSIPVSRIDSLYAVLLAKENIHVGYRIVQTAIHSVDSTEKNFTVNIDSSSKIFVTKNVPVGFLSPVFYKAAFDNPASYILKRISVQLLLSFLLVALTITSFIVIYRNLIAQKRLTAIKNEFIGNITHELKTPIATVSVAIEAMKNFNALQSPERTQEYLGIAGQELNRLSLLVDKVLRLSMFETQQVELKYEWFDVKELVVEIMNSMDLQFQKAGAVVNLNSGGSDFTLMADRMHITSVLYNLLDNALKYSQTKPLIDIDINSENANIIIKISDHGVGIPVVYKDKIFDKFFRVPNGDKHNVKGYGLGLSYVAHIIKEHRGTIQVESEQNKGTSFIIKLPRENAS